MTYFIIRSSDSDLVYWKLNPFSLLKIRQTFYSWSLSVINAWLCGSMFCLYVFVDSFSAMLGCFLSSLIEQVLSSGLRVLLKDTTQCLG